ncbi:PREDICTED: natriuretic peptide Mf-NP-like [Tauraco erythrolophus]|uniref:natriuretic peptide Mf-NP-like n=1 Tax=Tauraco erythrolophus TaxID=121530 RepID=UPI0005239CDA|nr:PREDICTED: natriuretic peptide Mf-NP-like [Tauraco erythrolophus]
MLGLQSWPCSLFLLLALLSASVQTVSLPGQRLQTLLSQLLPLEPESTLGKPDTKEGPLLASRKWALPGDWAWKAVPRGCFGLKLDRIGTFSGLGC